MKLSKPVLEFGRRILAEYCVDNDVAAETILKQALECLETIRRAQAQVDKDGLTVLGDRGQIKAHPLLATIRDARSQFLASLRLLNLDVEPLRDGPGRPPKGV